MELTNSTRPAETNAAGHNTGGIKAAKLRLALAADTVAERLVGIALSKRLANDCRCMSSSHTNGGTPCAGVRRCATAEPIHG